MLLPLGKALQLLLKKVIDIYEKEIQELSIKSAECRMNGFGKDLINNLY
jgi:hypothetical protein